MVGEKTFGEGNQQKTIELPDEAALILSVAKYERRLPARSWRMKGLHLTVLQ